ncbi:unnamed protein product [Prorocentrum cordatum]|uniref:Uncharacterized protein n=1 Tax=Prorocentrum cordatum TaxID=2364126 RepID=A0ABN9UYG5_9DINO|nr:unnamed protein product [Polarella glacialis]
MSSSSSGRGLEAQCSDISLDQVLSECGLGFFHKRLLVTCGFGFSAAAVEVVLTAFLFTELEGHGIYAKEFYDISVVMWRLTGQHMAFITAYLTASIGLADDNIRKMEHLLQITRSLGNIHWMTYCDLNNTPQEFVATPWLSSSAA